jgi:prolyl 4-hydroxylase
MIGYFLALIPTYLFLYLPISQLLYGPTTRPSHDRVPFNISFIAPDEPAPSECEDWKGGAHILSREPLIMYLENWLGMEETAHLEEIRYGTISPSQILTLLPFPSLVLRRIRIISIGKI